MADKHVKMLYQLLNVTMKSTEATLTYYGCPKIYIYPPGFTVQQDPEGFKCDRCGLKFRYTMTPDGGVQRDPCQAHSGKRKVKEGDRYRTWTCCGGGFGAKGCTEFSNHVTSTNKDGIMGNDYLQETEEAIHGEDERQIFALDCEMVYTTIGREVARVTLLDWRGDVVLDELVLPTHPVVDYATPYSGITEESLRGVSMTFERMRQIMKDYIKKDTILVGHGLENDLLVLKLVHHSIVDTALVTLIKNKFKRSLKSVALDFLGRTIQEGDSGHDSSEDARAALDVAKHLATEQFHEYFYDRMWHDGLEQGEYGQLFRKERDGGTWPRFFPK